MNAIQLAAVAAIIIGTVTGCAVQAGEATESSHAETAEALTVPPQKPIDPTILGTSQGETGTISFTGRGYIDGGPVIVYGYPGTGAGPLVISTIVTASANGSISGQFQVACNSNWGLIAVNEVGDETYSNWSWVDAQCAF